jgi:hypothetical protein
VKTRASLFYRTGELFTFGESKKIRINACRIKNFWQSLQRHPRTSLQVPEKHPFHFISNPFLSDYPCSDVLYKQGHPARPTIVDVAILKSKYETHISVPIIDSSFTAHAVFI